jgi:hypothetical protein
MGHHSTTLNSLTAQQVQNIYADAQVTQLQNCGGIPSDENIIEVVGNFNNVEFINQLVQDGSTMNCTFQGASQQQVQDQLVAELTAQAESQANASNDYFGPLGVALSGSVVNKVSVDATAVQNAVTQVITSQIQNCTSNSCNPNSGGAGTIGATGTPSTACNGAMSCPATGCTSCNPPGSSNVVCVDGNFNNVTNVTQNMEVDWVKNCFYNAQVTQNVTSALQSQMNAISQATTNDGLTLIGWLLFACLIFVMLGALVLGGTYLYKRSPSTS